MKIPRGFFRMQYKLVECEEHGEPYQEKVYYDEPPHVVRSVGNSVGVPAGRNTNRVGAKYKRKANRIARRLGFVDATHRAVFTAMIVAAHAKKQEEGNGSQDV